jgi:1-acyl-sn-glycerol-3-phosphate acyltransferase
MMNDGHRVKTCYYASYEEDFVESGNQDFALPEDYRWTPVGIGGKVASSLAWALGLLVAYPFCKLHLHARFTGAERLKASGDRGAFVYCNHTQPVGDALMPALPIFPKRNFTVVSPANLGIPVLGRILPALGALPVPGTLAGLRKLDAAIEQRIEEGAFVVIYPEAHVWPWFTGIRPFPDTSFAYPVKLGVPAFSMTTTYERRRGKDKPRAHVYVDGPFWPNPSLGKKGQREDLKDRVRSCMERRADNSDCSYVEYLPKGVERT